MAAGATWRGRYEIAALCGLLAWVQMGCSGSRADVPASAASQPAASQPASERVLIRIIKKADPTRKAEVTQADVEKILRNEPLERRRTAARDALFTILNNKTFLFYIQEHPELVTEQDLEKEIATDLKLVKLKSADDFRRSLEESGVTWDEYLGLAKIRAARGKMMRLGVENAVDKEYLRKLFDEHPDYFDDTRVRLRHIVFGVPLTATEEQKKARYEELARLREEILSGKKTWNEAVQLSEDNTRTKNGLLGPLPRFMRLEEPLMAAAWPLQPGQITDVVESPKGLHIIQVMERIPGKRPYEDPHTRFELQTVAQGQPLFQLTRKIQQELTVVGVQPMDMASIMALPPPATRPAVMPPRPSTRPGMTRPSRPTTRPGMVRPTTRPATTRPTVRPPTRPGAVTPATRPAPRIRPTSPAVPGRSAATRPVAAPRPRPSVPPRPATTRPATAPS